MTKSPIMTAYRQQALVCAASLSNGPRRIAEIKSAIPDAPKILLRNVYGWFIRVERGVYALTQEGRAALLRWPVLPGENMPHISHSGSCMSDHATGLAVRPIDASKRETIKLLVDAGKR